MHALTMFSLLPFGIAAVQAERSEGRIALMAVVVTGIMFALGSLWYSV